MTIHTETAGPPATGPTRLRPARRYVALMASVASAFAVEGIAEPGRWELVLLTVLLGTALLLSLQIARARPSVMRCAQAVIAAVVAFGFARAAGGHIDERAVRATTALLVVLAPPAIVVGVVRHMRETQTVSVETVLGVLCVYVLLGLFFSFVYGAVDRLGGRPFFAQRGAAASMAACLYYSFTTLTTVGYGDLTAASNLGHTLSVTEALLGQIYLVTVVSLVVSNLGRRR